MSNRSRPFAVSLLCLAFTLVILPAWRPGATAPQSNASAEAREEAYRANNLGVALLEQFKHKEGAEQFRRALKLDPRLALARINLAIALLYLPDALNARKEALAAAAVAPEAPQPHYVLGLLGKSENKPEEALAAFQRVLKIDPRDVGANVQMGQLYAQQRKYPEAVAAFRAALAEEPYNGTALYNLGTALLRAGQREEGQRLVQQFQALRQSGAATTIGQNYLEQGRYAEAVSSTGAEADVVDKRTPEVVFTNATTSFLPGAKPNAPGADNPFKGGESGDVLNSGVTLFDFDGDGDLDLFGPGLRLRRNDGGKFADLTQQSGLVGKDARFMVNAGVAGDYDNDGRPDLFVVGYAGLALYRNEGAGRFSDVTAAARVPSYPYTSSSAAFVDADHDGDLDIFVAGYSDAPKAPPLQSTKETPTEQARQLLPAPNLLLRNNGDGTFADVTAAAKLDVQRGHAIAVVPTDYDNRRDVDLLVVVEDGPPALWRNLRDGTFRDIAAEVGLNLKGASCVAAGDVNKDGFTDFFFGVAAGGPGTFALSDGKGRFNLRNAPADEGASKARSYAQRVAQFLDYDNDGLLDLLVVARTEGPSGAALQLWRNTGDGWADVSEKATRELSARFNAAASSPAYLASGDLDDDGDVDLVLADFLSARDAEAVTIARNEGGSRNASVRVRLAGKVSNRGGVGVKVELRAGSLQQKLETYAASPAPAPADVVFGLGRRERADAVRVLWPSGVVQSESEFAASATVRPKPAAPLALTIPVTELDRKPSSCPYLYAWNGERFEFVTDFMGGGELGYWVAPGVRAAPDPDEYVRIRGDQLKERGGRYELRVTNELEEALFVDHLKLVAVAHPSGVEVYPNEGLGNPTSKQFKLSATRDARPPAAAHDEHGHDVLAKIASMDRQYPDDFKLARIRGYADEHALVLDLEGGTRETDKVKNPRRGVRGRNARAGARGVRADGERVLLLMTGWTDYAFSSDNVAASQSGMALKPPALQVRDARGEWRTVIEDIGIPVGRPQTVAVDLTGKFLSASREVRVLTNMRIYWDEVLVDTSGGKFPFELRSLRPASADLSWRGFSAETTPDGREPYSYDYARVSATSPWKTMAGRYTREGDVRDLLQTVDDIFVISRPGDELSLSFDATRLPPLPEGWTRTFLLYADGFSKEMDINSASPDQVAPLPFHGMKSYPYAAPESYPWTPARRASAERYNTRVVASPLNVFVGEAEKTVGQR